MNKTLTMKWTLWIIILLLSAENVSANPKGANVISGQATLAHPSANALTITNSPNAIINWQSFDINPNEITRFIQQNSASAVLNRVVGNGLTASQIMGTLASNGKVFLVNPNGIVFGPNSVVDTAGLIASSLNISDQDFLNNNLSFDGNASNGAIENKGYIKAGLNGDVFLIAPNIENSGIIETNGGHIILAAGEKVSLASFENENIVFQVQSPDNKVTNLGSIITNGGAAELFAGTITHSGSINADSVSVDSQGQVVLAASHDITLTQESQITSKSASISVESESGELLQQGTLTANQIHLSGSMVNNVGQTQASSTDMNTAEINIEGDYVLQQGVLQASGGNINVQATNLYHSGLTSTDNPEATAGNITINTSNRLDATGGSLISATGLTGGTITLDGNTGQIVTSATLSASGTQSGGTVEVTANTVALLNANIKSDGGTTGGSIHIGGEWQGSGDLDHAKEVIIGVGTELSATGDAGGEIVIWSTESTSFYGSADTRGALQGGQIELSSQGSLDWMGPDFAPITPGDGGLLLLDPKNINVTDTPPGDLSLATKLAHTAQSSTSLSLVDNVYFGLSVALDGDLLAVGSQDHEFGADRGAVYLFNGVGADYSGLTLQNKLAHGSLGGALSLANGDRFGSSLALDSGLLAVGARFDNTGGTRRGAAYLFNGVGTDYSDLTLIGKLANISTGGLPNITLANDDRFGISVALDGDLLAVGAQLDSTGATFEGAVHLFNTVGTDYSGLTHLGKLASTSTGGLPNIALAASDFFGTSVALDGDLLAVGSMGDGTHGAAYLFNGVGTDFSGLTLQNKLTDGSLSGTLSLINFGNFGSAVSLDGNRLIVGARTEDTDGGSRGAAYLFTNTAGDFSGLTLTGKLASTSTGGLPNMSLSVAGGFGTSVSLDGDLLAIGANEDDTGGNNRGAIYLFDSVAANFTGITLQNKFANGSNYLLPSPLVIADGDEFGRSVSLDGDLLAVGAYFADIGGVDRGAVYLFNGVGTDFSGLTLQDKLTHGWTDGTATLTLVDSDFLGASLALDGGRLAVGAYGNDTGGTLAGSVYLFNGVGTDYSGLTLQDQLVSGWSDGVSTLTLAIGDLFGWSLSLNGDFLAIGATGDDTGGAQRGAVHLFNGVGTDFSGLTIQDKLADGWTDGASTLTLVDNDNFGNALSVNGDLLAVGAYRDDTGGSSRGAVYLFNGVGTDYSGLTLKDKLVAGWSDGTSNLSLADGDIFGASVSLDGDLLAVGANGDDTGGSNRGAIHLFDGVGTDYSGLTIQDKLAHGWTDGISTLTLVDSDQFGVSVSLDGDRLAVGSFLDDTGGNSRGAVYLFNGISSGSVGSTGDALFGSNPANTLYLTTTSTNNVLDTGASLILQANNDITITNGISALGAATGDGGDLSILAGRSISINANIDTNGGDFTAIANSSVGDGVTDAQRDAGAANFTLQAGDTINTGGGAILIKVSDGAGLTNNTAGDIVIDTGASISGGSIDFDSQGNIDIKQVVTVDSNGATIDLTSQGDIDLDSGSTIDSGGGTIDITANGTLSLKQISAVGSTITSVGGTGGNVTIMADDLDLQTGSLITTPGTFSGNLTIMPFSTNQDIYLGTGGPGTPLEISAAELTRMTAIDTLTIGRSIGTGNLTVAENLTSAGINASTLVLKHQTITTNNAIDLSGGENLKLVAAAGIDINNAVDAGDVTLEAPIATFAPVTAVNIDSFTINGTGSPTASFDGAGTTLFRSSTALNTVVQSAGTIDTSAGQTVTIGGTYAWTGGTIDGSVTANSVTTVTNTVTLNGLFNNNGAFTWSGGNINGTLGGGSGFNNNSGGTFNATGDGTFAQTFTNSGNLTKAIGTGTTTFSGDLTTSSGSVSVNSGTIEFDGYTQTGGITILNGGNLTDTSGDGFDFDGGTLKGVGTLTTPFLNVNNGATFAPGSSPGTFNVVGDLNLSPTSTLLIELGGTTQGTGYDFVNVTGDVALDGTLNISLFGGFTGIVGNQFDIISSGTNIMTGAFANTIFPTGYTISQGIIGGGAFYQLGLLVVPVIPTSTDSDLDLDSIQEQTTNEVLVLEENFDSWTLDDIVFAEDTTDEYDDQALICS